VVSGGINCPYGGVSTESSAHRIHAKTVAFARRAMEYRTACAEATLDLLVRLMWMSVRTSHAEMERPALTNPEASGASVRPTSQEPAAEIPCTRIRFPLS